MTNESTISSKTVEVAIMMAEGNSASAIAGALGITRQRVHQIAKKADLGAFPQSSPPAPRNELMAVRNALGWTQDQMAEYLCVDRSSISRMETSGRMKGLVRRALEQLIVEHKLRI